MWVFLRHNGLAAKSLLKCFFRCYTHHEYSIYVAEFVRISFAYGSQEACTRRNRFDDKDTRGLVI
jgi:hypothetical protein